MGIPGRVHVEPSPRATQQGTGEGYVVVTQHPSSVRDKSPRIWRLRGPSLRDPSPAAGKWLERERGLGELTHHHQALSWLSGLHPLPDSCLPTTDRRHLKGGVRGLGPRSLGAARMCRPSF